MSMRPIKLPDDLLPLGELLVDTFQYPENEAWSVQSDEQEQLVEGMKNLSRMWPLIRLIQVLSPPLRDLLRGYVWEEDGQMVGTTIVQRRGSTDIWFVGTVGVSPAYRRRGIARRCVEAGIDLIRKQGGSKAILSVIDGNVPAYALYEDLGFEDYAGEIDYEAWLEEAPPAPSLPAGYVQVPLGTFDWQPRYELEQRIIPGSLLKYEPVEVGRFRHPAMTRLLYPLITAAQGIRDKDFVIRTAGQGEVVARGGYTIPTRGKGVNHLRARLDAAHADLAHYLVGTLLHEVMTLSPGHRVEMTVPQWMEDVVAAAEAAGLERRVAQRWMGLVL
jgi:ribosomal protein S18 acetylase RimI-like enzyme